MNAPSLVFRGLAALLLLMAAGAAQADLMLFPTRIVFEGRQRAGQVELMNSGAKPETYRLHLVNRRMGPNGEFISIETPGPGEQFADAMVVFSPHQVTIPPGGSQVVRILLKKPTELADGEYRSHLQIDRVPEASGASSVEQMAKPDSQEVGVVIQALIGASIPVIVRQGQTHAQAKLSKLALMPSGPGQPGGALSLSIERDGTRSVYGDLTVSFTTAAGVTLQLARANGVAVYVPNPSRSVLLPLTLPGGQPLPAGTLHATFRDRPEAGAKLLADASLVLP
ncbi:MAG: molecular chaperone [Paucibacter sp.]|nr:molecular chaperone [Roseateles sp.]